MSSWATGALLSVFGSVCGNLGVNVQKFSLTREGYRPLSERRPFWKQKRYVFGLILIIFGSLGDFAALSMVAQSIVAPLGSIALVANICFAHFWLGERVGWTELFGTACIMIGSTLSVVFGNHSDPTYTNQELLDLISGALFISYVVVALSLILWGILIHLRVTPWKQKLIELETQAAKQHGHGELIPVPTTGPAALERKNSKAELQRKNSKAELERKNSKAELERKNSKAQLASESPAQPKKKLAASSASSAASTNQPVDAVAVGVNAPLSPAVVVFSDEMDAPSEKTDRASSVSNAAAGADASDPSAAAVEPAADDELYLAAATSPFGHFLRQSSADSLVPVSLAPSAAAKTGELDLGELPELRAKFKPWQKFHPFLLCALSGTLGAQSILFGKCFSVLLATSVAGDNQMRNIFPWVCLVCMLIFIFSQLYFMAQALSCYDSLYCVPVFQCFFIFVSAMGGAAYFREVHAFTRLQAIMFPLGFAITLGGVAILTLRSRKATHHHFEDVAVAAEEARLEAAVAAAAGGSPSPPPPHPVGGRSHVTPVLGRQASRASLHASSRAPAGAALSWPAHSQVAVNAATVPSSAGSFPKSSAADPTATPSVVPHFHTDDTVSPVAEEHNQV